MHVNCMEMKQDRMVLITDPLGLSLVHGLQKIYVAVTVFQSYYDLDWLLLVVLRIYLASAIFQPHCDLLAGDTKSLKSKWWDPDLNTGLLTPLASRLITVPQPLSESSWISIVMKPTSTVHDWILKILEDIWIWFNLSRYLHLLTRMNYRMIMKCKRNMYN